MMTHKYKLTGMTCSSCEAKVKSNLLSIGDVLSVEVSRTNETAIIEMQRHISINDLQIALGGKTSRYRISAMLENKITGEGSSWLQTYKPILLIFSFITGISLLVNFQGGEFSWMRWMSHFMGGFFITFSFFKLLNLKGFAESYAMYDIVAKRWYGWGYIYGFIELALGLAFLTAFNPIITNAVTFIVMSVSIVGVLQSVWSKAKIRCACLGDVFNLPMSTITIIEDALMIGMSGLMLKMMF